MEKQKETRELAVVSDLPQVPTRIIKGNDGKEYELMTDSEALKEILETVRVLKKGITG